MQAIGYNCSKLQSLNLGWCDRVGDEGVKSLAYGCPDLRALDLCGCVLITGTLFSYSFENVGLMAKTIVPAGENRVLMIVQ